MHFVFITLQYRKIKVHKCTYILTLYQPEPFISADIWKKCKYLKKKLGKNEVDLFVYIEAENINVKEIIAQNSFRVKANVNVKNVFKFRLLQ